ncbi:hypothetical protein H257_17624 [Aphanomyces astaci]|uniref:Uncharacterized protein n=1 Tax=Aphanomyces astaci TaxID=112090 RepID=W4FFU1_APHAT|nr:hypothetical protein H257_17624 [Aphanomyces astaci]ETV65739.1 hypothetical protein H257_17624 [Aphanomyces astaci]|eukprot:XP_009844791.1 hypothetical protein H257_17624 [Aphanomyces astaci]
MDDYDEDGNLVTAATHGGYVNPFENRWESQNYRVVEEQKREARKRKAKELVKTKEFIPLTNDSEDESTSRTAAIHPTYTTNALAKDRAKIKYELALVAQHMQNGKMLKPKAKKLRDSLMTVNKKWREEQEQCRVAKTTEPEKKKLQRMLENPIGESVATINGVLDMPYCPDNAGRNNPNNASANSMGWKRCRKPTRHSEEDGGIAGHSENGRWTVKLPGKQLFYVVDDNYELIVSKYALMSIGLDMDRLLEQAARANDKQLDMEDMRAAENLYKMATTSANAADQAQAAAFKQLRGIVVDAAAKGVWRTKFRGTGLPANVKAMEIRLKADACPNRCKPRKVNPLTGMFVEAFSKQLEQDQVIYANSSSSHCSPVNPVMKPEGKKLVKTSDKWTIEELLQYFRLTIDYRIINSETIPLVAGAMPFQFLVLENVLGLFHLT